MPAPRFYLPFSPVVATLAVLLLLTLAGCSAKPEAAPGTAPSTPSVAPETAEPRLTDEHFAEILRRGLEDQTDLSSLAVELFEGKAVKVLTVVPLTDEATLNPWKGILERDELLEPKDLEGFKVYVTVTVSADAPEGTEPEFSSVLLLKWKTLPSWTVWYRRQGQWNGAIDRSLTPQHLEEVIQNGLLDGTDLTSALKEQYSLEKEKAGDPGLVEYRLVSATLITDVEKLRKWEAFLTGDQTVVPTNYRAVKVYEVVTTQRYEPPRPNSGHSDAPHDGQNSFLVVFYQAKPGGAWIYGGAYL